MPHRFCNLLIILLCIQLQISNSEVDWFCGESLFDASIRCSIACPTGLGCPSDQFCFSGTKCSTKSSDDEEEESTTTTYSGTIKTFGHEAVEETFLTIKNVINTKLFLYETPDMEWLPSTVYRFDGFFDGLRLMYKQGVNGKKVYVGGNDPTCKHCHMYGVVNIAAFLAQAMKETIRYDACDENSWDRVGAMKMYPISNACGQLGQSYQDYHCKEEERFMECEIDKDMTIKAVTNAKWWGAPGPLFCGPKSLYPHTGYWDYSFECNNQWANPPEFCNAYVGQKGGKHIDDMPYENAAGRTDVEGCCWWGRGVIQTSGVCNFGKLNYFLGRRAFLEGRESRYPDIDFCKDPEAICANDKYKELKWIAGFFYWVDQVQPYDNEGWNYIDELHNFVDNGMKGDGFINAVSGIVNRGCHNPPCGTGALDGGPERAENFFRILKEMTFAWVEVNPIQPTPAPTEEPAPIPTDQPQTPRPTSSPINLPLSTTKPTYTPISPPPTTSYPIQSSVDRPPDSDDSSPYIIEYICGNGPDSNGQITSDITFAYEIHNNLDVSAGDALKEAKKSILADIANRLGCSETSNIRFLQLSEDYLSKVIGIASNSVDGVDRNVAGCTVEVETNTSTTCTPVMGGITILAKSGTNPQVLEGISDHIKEIIEYSMTFGEYESKAVAKAVYIGDRIKSNDKGITASVDPYMQPESSKVTLYALYALIIACVLLLCLLYCAIRSARRGARKQISQVDDDLALMEDNYNFRSGAFDYRDEPQHVIHGQNPILSAYEDPSMNSSQRSRRRSSSRGRSRRNIDPDDSHQPRRRSSSRDVTSGLEGEYSRSTSQQDTSTNFSRASTNGSRGHSQASFQPPPSRPRSKSPSIQNSRRKPPPPNIMRAADIDDNSGSDSDGSQEYPPPMRRSSTGTSSNKNSRDKPKPPPPMRRANTGEPGYSQNSQSNFQSRASTGMISPKFDDGSYESRSAASDKEERRKRLEAAKARAMNRRSARDLV